MRKLKQDDSLYLILEMISQMSEEELSELSWDELAELLRKLELNKGFQVGKKLGSERKKLYAKIRVVKQMVLEYTKGITSEKKIKNSLPSEVSALLIYLEKYTLLADKLSHISLEEWPMAIKIMNAMVRKGKNIREKQKKIEIEKFKRE